MSSASDSSPGSPSPSSSPPSRSPSCSSSSPEPEVPSVNSAKKSKDKGKKKKSTLPEHPENEGTDPNWAYKPPKGVVLLDHAVDSGEFDWDAVNNDDNLELCLIRVPDGVKPKYLENAKVDLSSPSKSARIGTLNRKHATYDIWSVGDNDDQPVGGEEIKGLSCLLPKRSKKGKLFQAPKAITRHLVISAQAVKPASDLYSGTTPNSPQVYKNPPRQSYPKELLKHKFMPYGSETRPASEDIPMDVDFELEGSPSKEPPSIEEPQVETKRPKGRKRKGERDVASSPKKTKKAKTAS